MAKTHEELNELIKECEALANKIQDLSEEELELITGGGIKDWFDKIGDMTKKVNVSGKAQMEAWDIIFKQFLVHQKCPNK